MKMITPPANHHQNQSQELITPEVRRQLVRVKQQPMDEQKISRQPTGKKPGAIVDYLSDLNPQQRQAVEYGIKPGNAKDVGPLAVIAGAGSGKTKTIAHRVAHLLVNGIDPRRILLLTFTCRAAEEMTLRVRQVASKALKNDKLDLPWSGTFHSIGARLLREYAQVVGLKPSFTILDRSDAADLMNLVRHDLNQSKKDKRFPKKDTCLSIYSLAVNSRAPLKQILATHFQWCAEWEDELRRLFTAYINAKQAQNVLDYDDLLLYWSAMLNDKDLAKEIGGRFDHVLVDEYQDTNRLQAEILQKLKPDGRGVMVVGDDAQAIYSFRAATVRNILEFPDQFKPRACVITLEENYRSTQPILYACNLVIGFAKERFTKNLRSERPSKQKPFLTTVLDEAAQARYVAERILAAREAGVPLKAQAVLFRSSHHAAQLEIELGRRNIPYVKYGGLKFLESAHVKDVVSVLRWCENPRDRVAGFRMLQLLPGIGPSTAAKILDKIATERKVIDVLNRFVVPNHAAEDWPAFTALISRLRKAKAWPSEFELLRTWYEPHLQRLYDDANTRAADIAQLQQIAAGFASRHRFLTELALDPPDATSGHGHTPLLDEDYTILSTIHSAKGQQYKIVRILNVVDGCIPSNMATGTTEEIEEERRLLYVAMTRTRDELDLIVPQRFFTYQHNDGDRNVYAAITRFIPKSIHHAFQLRHWRERSDDATINNSKSHPRIDIAESVGRMWR
jgi:DNA helicase-2/ATP-dependent DNA helicase PcrA